MSTCCEHNDSKKNESGCQTDYGHGHQTDHGGHGASCHGEGMMADFRRRFWTSLMLTAPLLVLSPLIQQALGFELDFAGREWTLFALATVIFSYGGWPFFKVGWQEIRQKAPGMMTLIALAISVAYFYSAAVVLGLEGKTFFWELATLIDIMLLGHWIEARSVMSASKALEKLAELIPDEAHLVEDGETREVPTSELKKGDVILVKPGEKIPADGKVQQGESSVNEALLTGEAKPVKKKQGSEVIGGSLNEDGSLTIEVGRVGKEAYLSKVIELVNQAQAAKSKTQNLADRAAFWLTFVALTAGVVTFAAWLWSGQDLSYAIERTATVLVITCPHALGLAIPLVVAVSTTLSAQNGLLIRNRTAFENARKISVLVFDKTGTLTTGVFGVEQVEVLDSEYERTEILRMAASLEQYSEHPLGKAVVKKAREEKIGLAEARDFRALRGRGVQGKVEDREVAAVSPGYARELGLKAAEDDETETEAGTLIWLAEKRSEDWRLIGRLTLMDTVHRATRPAIRQLKKQGLKIWMLTGDNEQAAKAVADELELDGFFAGVLPEEKQKKIGELQDKGEFVAMVGDGINDAPALAAADVGIAIGSGTDVAAETADIILVNSDPGDLVTLINFGKATYNKMVQNLIWATGYNTLAIPLAAGALAAWGIILSPAVGAVLMSLSTVIVAVNAKMLRVGR